MFKTYEWNCLNFKHATTNNVMHLSFSFKTVNESKNFLKFYQWMMNENSSAFFNLLSSIPEFGQKVTILYANIKQPLSIKCL